MKTRAVTSINWAVTFSAEETQRLAALSADEAIGAMVAKNVLIEDPGLARTCLAKLLATVQPLCPPGEELAVEGGSDYEQDGTIMRFHPVGGSTWFFLSRIADLVVLAAAKDNVRLDSQKCLAVMELFMTMLTLNPGIFLPGVVAENPVPKPVPTSRDPRRHDRYQMVTGTLGMMEVQAAATAAVIRRFTALAGERR